jgi:hypothetical protein
MSRTFRCAALAATVFGAAIFGAPNAFAGGFGHGQHFAGGGFVQPAFGHGYHGGHIRYGSGRYYAYGPGYYACWLRPVPVYGGVVYRRICY